LSASTAECEVRGGSFRDHRSRDGRPPGNERFVCHAVPTFDSGELYLDLQSERAHDDRLPRDAPHPAHGRRPSLVAGALVSRAAAAIVHALADG
jgi:hypothetical protein